MQRFWSKIKTGAKKDCWNWQAGLNTGYGFYAICINNHRSYYFAHRYSWVLSYGQIPEEKQVLHKCDNRRCTNPDHLFLGDISDNMRDKVFKGRHARGEKVTTSKLTDKKVKEIRKLRPKHTIDYLMFRYKVSKNTIINVCKKRSWKHIK